MSWVITFLGGKRSAAGIREGFNGGEIFFFGSHPYLLPKRSTFFTQIIQFPPIFRVMGSLSDLLPLFLHSYLPLVYLQLIDRYFVHCTVCLEEGFEWLYIDFVIISKIDIYIYYIIYYFRFNNDEFFFLFISRLFATSSFCFLSHEWWCALSFSFHYFLILPCGKRLLGKESWLSRS